MRLVLDTNVLVYAFVSPEFVSKVRKEEWLELHEKARELYRDILKSKHELIIPSIVLKELAAVISGMVGEKEAREDVENVRSVALIDYDDPMFTQQAINYGVKLKLSGFDTDIATCAIINSTNLITNDRKFYDKFLPKSKEYGIKLFLLRKMKIKEIKNLL